MHTHLKTPLEQEVYNKSKHLLVKPEVFVVKGIMYVWIVIYLFTNSFIQQVFIECLL